MRIAVTHGLILVLGAAAALIAAEPPANPYLRQLDANGSLRLELNDELKHPHFTWPATLLTYRIMYDPARTSPERLEVVDGAGKPIPAQISAVANAATPTCTVSFVSDLPSGAQRVFTVRTAPTAITAPTPATPVTVSDDANGVILATGLVRLRLPASTTTVDPEAVPGPLQGADDGHGWIGTSRVRIPGQRVIGITTTVRERGALRSVIEVAYRCAGSASYVVTCTAKSGYNFIEWDESISGVAKEANAGMTIDWTGFKPTHRRGDELINQPKILMHRGEDPYFAGPEGVEDPAREMYFRLVPAQADSTISTLAADFSDRVGKRAVGLAVLDAAKWDDSEYALWASNPTLGVRFRYGNGLLSWDLPLATGRRSLALALLDLSRPASGLPGAQPNDEVALANTGRAADRSWLADIANRHCSLSLDRVKDWQLGYGDDLPQPANHDLPQHERKQLRDPASYLKALWEDKGTLANTTGVWVSPVSLRIMSDWVVPGFVRHRAAFSPAERRRASAMLLFQAYYAAREELSPMRRMLKGHPNFMADWKYSLLAGSYLFPGHPLAAEWADQYAKLIQVQSIFWVRPTVAAWEAHGGRWTESLGVYNWAFLQPTLRATHLGRLFDHRERAADPGLAQHGDYLVGVASAPIRIGKAEGQPELKPGTPLTPANGFQRIHPMQGAHAGRRPVPPSAGELGEALLRYRPLTGEHLLWLNQRPPLKPGTVAEPTGEPNMALATTNRGTNPRLKSGKFTGYGIVMRAAVDTPDEIAVYLQQIDQGPNYRWGFANEGGCGDVYYYAGGRSFAGHQGEDTGDRRSNDTENTCNTGVYKGQTFRGIGMNELTEPFYPLEAAQFAELVPRQGPGAYSWPEYQRRSLMLVGSDYILTHDALNNPSRTVWTSIAAEDAKPTLIPLQGEIGFRIRQETMRPGKPDTLTVSERFDCYKGSGDRLMLVSHRTDLVTKMRKVDGGAVAEITVGSGKTAGRDVVLCQREAFTVAEPNLQFSGRAGVVRHRPGGSTELALFRGQRIGSGGLLLAVDRDDLGVSAVMTAADEISGVSFSRTGGTLTLTRPQGSGKTVQVAIDGAPVPTTADGASLVFAVPAGLHRWQLTAGTIEPMPAQIARTIALTDGVQVTVAPVASATSYRLERSADTGETWTPVGETADGNFTIQGVTAPTKFHLRAIALNGRQAARPGTDYPVYVTGTPVLPPTGLRLAPSAGQVVATWGEVLGAREYRLYRQRTANGPWELAYAGSATTATDTVPGLMAPYADPGLAEAAIRPVPAGSIVRYAVSAVDGIGEGPRSLSETTDPSAWTNWLPAVPLKFRRQSAYWLPPYVAPELVPPAFYPE